jgi:hypothetical protein
VKPITYLQRVGSVGVISVAVIRPTSLVASV